MPSVKSVESKIEKLEGIKVRIRHNRDGRDVRSDMQIPAYPYRRAAKDSMNVATWKQQRFRKRYPGFERGVLDRRSVIHGKVLLGKVRSFLWLS